MSFEKVFSIHFPKNQVYVNSTCYPLEEKIEQIKDNKDHKLFKVFKVYPDPEIREEGDTNSVSVKEVEKRYYEDSYMIIGRNWWVPFSHKKIFSFFDLYSDNIK